MDNKTKILKNAVKLFSEKGYDAVGIQELVNANKITKPTLYYHFGSKEGLLKEIYKSYFTTFNDGLKINVDVNLLIEKIYIHPKSENWYKNLVIQLVAKLGFDISIEKSDLESDILI